MAKKSKLQGLKEEFLFLENDVIGVLLFGSTSNKTRTKRSDVDVCVVAGKQKPLHILSLVYQKIDAYKKKYDVYIFEELPLYMKAEILRNHKVIISKDVPVLYEYLYFYRKLWDGQKHRQEITKKEILKMF